MRIMIFLLFALAIGKIATQSYIQQQSAKSTIINAYREHALAACREQGLNTGHEWVGSNTQATKYGRAGRPSVSIELVIGKRDLDVRLWQTSHRNWSARYRDPFIIVRTRDDSGPQLCEYDITNGTVYAAVRQLRENS